MTQMYHLSWLSRTEKMDTGRNASMVSATELFFHDATLTRISTDIHEFLEECFLIMKHMWGKPAVVLCTLNISCCHLPRCLVLTETHWKSSHLTAVGYALGNISNSTLNPLVQLLSVNSAIIYRVTSSSSISCWEVLLPQFSIGLTIVTVSLCVS